MNCQTMIFCYTVSVIIKSTVLVYSMADYHHLQGMDSSGLHLPISGMAFRVYSHWSSVVVSALMLRMNTTNFIGTIQTKHQLQTHAKEKYLVMS